MLSKTKGIILRNLKYSESSMVLDIFTEDFGKRSYIISGIYGKKSKTKAGILQIMNQVEVLAYHKNDDGLNRIKEIKPSYLYQHLPFQIAKSSVGLFMTEICQKTIKEKEQNIELYNFLVNSFTFLDQTTESISSFHHLFMIELSYLIGFGAGNNWSESNAFFHTLEGRFYKQYEGKSYSLGIEQSAVFHSYLSSNLLNSHLLNFSKQTRMSILIFLIKYYELHIEGFRDIKSLSVLKDLMR